MEKIQSAIAKARAARAAIQSGEEGRPVAPAKAAPQAEAPLVLPAAPVRADDDHPDPAAVAAFWSALPGFAAAPGLLARGHVVTAAGGREAVPFDLSE